MCRNEMIDYVMYDTKILTKFFTSVNMSSSLKNNVSNGLR